MMRMASCLLLALFTLLVISVQAQSKWVCSPEGEHWGTLEPRGPWAFTILDLGGQEIGTIQQKRIEEPIRAPSIGRYEGAVVDVQTTIEYRAYNSQGIWIAVLKKYAGEWYAYGAEGKEIFRTCRR